MDKENQGAAPPPQQVPDRGEPLLKRTPTKTYSPRRARIRPKLALDDSTEAAASTENNDDQETSKKRKFPGDSSLDKISWMSNDAANPFASVFTKTDDDADFLVTKKAHKRFKLSTPTSPITPTRKPALASETNALVLLMSPKKPAETKSPTPTKRRKVAPPTKDTSTETCKKEREKETEEEESHQKEEREEKSDNEKGKEKEQNGETGSGSTTPQRKMRQMYLDFGQKHLDWKVCPQCEMMYTPGIPTEETMHTRFHKKAMAEKQRSAFFG